MSTVFTYAFVLIFVAWSVAEVCDLVRMGHPKWLVFLEGVTDGFLLVGMALYLSGVSIPSLNDGWYSALLASVAVEMFLRTTSFRNEERDLEMSEAANALVHKLAFAIVFVLLVPAVIMNYHLARPDAPLSSFVVVSLPIVLGVVVGMLFPSLKTTFPSSNERKMVQWLRASPDFDSAPDKIELVGSLEQDWPGAESPEYCHLFRIWYGDKSFVGLNGPTTHCLPDPVADPFDVDEIYDKYKDWYADKLSSEIIKHAAKDMPEEFRELVNDALNDETPPS